MFRVFLAAILWLLPVAVFAQSPEKLEDHGLKSAYYIYHPDRERMVAQLIIDRGEAHNPYVEGMAHYVEHLAWLNALGLNHGDPSRHANASTTLTETTYWLSGDQSEFVEMLQKLHRIFLPFEIGEQFMAEERDIILREYDYRVRENAFYPVYQDLTDAVYGDTVYGRDVLGTLDDIEKFSIEEARQLHKDTHKYQNASLIIMGNLPIGAVRKLVSSEFPPTELISTVRDIVTLDLSSARNQKTIQVADQRTPELVFEKYVRTGAERSSSQLGLELQILEDILESTRTGGLEKPLRYDNFIARDYDLDLDQPLDGYIRMSFYAVPDRGVDLEQLLAAFETSFQSTVENGIPAATFEKMLKRAVDEYEAEINRSEFVYSGAPYYLSLNEEPQSYDQYLQNLKRVTLDQVNSHLKVLAGFGRTEIRFVIPMT